MVKPAPTLRKSVHYYLIISTSRKFYKYPIYPYSNMATREKLTRIIAGSLHIRGFVRENSKAIRRATDILVGVSEDLVAESAKVRAGLKEKEVARTTFESKYFAALKETREWQTDSMPGSEDYRVAEALLKHLEIASEQYGIRREYSSSLTHNYH